MRTHSLLAVLASNLLLGCSGTSGEEMTPQALGHRVFEAFQQSDYELLRESLLKAEDLEDVSANLTEQQLITSQLGLNKEQLDEEDKEVLRQAIVEVTKASTLVQNIQIKKRFGQVQKQAQQCGIMDWESAEFVTCTFTENERDGIRHANLTIPFRWRGLSYTLNVPDCTHTPRGWAVSSAPRLECSQAQLNTYPGAGYDSSY